MQASVKLGLALIAAAFSGAVCAEAGSQETVLKNQSKFKSTVGDEAQMNFNPKEFPLKKDNGPHTGAAPLAPPVAGVPLTPVPVVPPVVEQPRPATVPAWPSKIDTITIKQGTRR